jgi:NDP-sugar pyrophosphorylase family protein
MQPLTAERAKASLPVLGLSLLGRVIRGLAEQGIRFFVLNAFHRPQSVWEALARDMPRPANAEVYVESELMGSGGALAAPAEVLARGELFLVHNGDTLVNVPVAALAAAATAQARRIGALLVRPGRSPGYGGVVLSGGVVAGHFAAGQNPVEGELATFLGVSVGRREMLKQVAGDRPSQLFPAVLLPLVREGWSLAATAYEGPWLEFTTPEQYLGHITALVSAGRADGVVRLPGGDAPIRALPEGAAFEGDGAALEAGATVRGAVALESGARAVGGAALADTVLLEDARVEGGASLRKVIVDRGVRVPGGTSCENGVVTAEPGGKLVFRPFAN